MAWLGDYVHYAVQNYQKYGVSYKGRSPQHYSGNIDNYLRQRKEIKYPNSFNYGALEQELRKNTPNILMQEQRLVNLDYGQKIQKFQSLIMNKATGEGATTFSESLSSKTDSELIADKKQFDALQKEIEYYNQKLMENETVYAPILKELVDKYQMLAAGGRRISILGNIQQGWNDYSAKTWEETLNGELGERIQESMKKSSKAALEEAIKKEVSTIPGLRSMLNVEDGRTVYQTTDKVGSSYKINAKPEEWEMQFKWNRKNIMSGNMKSIYHDNGYGGVSFTGNTTLGTVLSMLDNENRFGTHWMNMHASQLDTSLDEDLRQAIIYDALVASKSELQRAGDFIYIDRNIGQVEHMHFWDVVDMAEFHVIPDPTTQRLDNSWVSPKNPLGESAYARVGNLLQQVHATNMQILSNVVYF